MRITSKGQLTIPVEIPEKTGLLPNTEVEFQIQGNAVTLKRKVGASSRRPRNLINRMRKKVAPDITTGEILALT